MVFGSSPWNGAGASSNVTSLPPKRPNYPEACGLRHLAFEAVAEVTKRGVAVEPVRVDPDGLPLELYER